MPKPAAEAEAAATAAAAAADTCEYMYMYFTKSEDSLPMIMEYPSGNFVTCVRLGDSFKLCEHF